MIPPWAGAVLGWYAGVLASNALPKDAKGNRPMWPSVAGAVGGYVLARRTR